MLIRSQNKEVLAAFEFLLYQHTTYYSNIVLDSQRIAKAADSTNTVQNVFEACHVTGT